MSKIEELKLQWINKTVSKQDFYSNISSFLANQEGEEYETAVKEVVLLINELGLTKIQSNKIWSAARTKRKMFTGSLSNEYITTIK